MDIPQSVQDLLKCDECNELLSCGPVFLMHDTGETICGRCSHNQKLQAESENRDKTRNNKYEAAAKLLRFPCAYATQGCPETMDFSTEEPNNHELNCEFRSFICPIKSFGECDWVGSWKKLQSHCNDKHNTQVFDNPCILPKPDLRTSNVTTYLISAFHCLFLLHVKFCLTSGKLFHSVRMFGDSKFLNNFSFSFIVEGNNMNVSKLGVVFPAHSLSFHESNAICTKINLLLDILDRKYNESKFIVKIQVRKCFYCSKELETVCDSKCCPECEEKTVRCKYYKDGCLFADWTKNKSKCVKHESFYCCYQKKCFLCQVDFSGSIYEHFESANSCRKLSRSNIGSVFRATPNKNDNVNYILFSSDINDDIHVVTYRLKNSTLDLWWRTSRPSHELQDLKCSVVLTDPQTKFSETVIPQFLLIEEDWHVNMKMNNYSSWESLGIDLKLEINNL